MCLRFEFSDLYTTPKLIYLLIKCQKLEELKVVLWDRIDEVLQYIPKTVRILEMNHGYFVSPTQYRQDFKDMIQRTGNKFTIFRIYYPLDTELLQMLESKLNVKNIAIELKEIPIKKFFQIVSHQTNLERLIIRMNQINSLIVNQDLTEYRFSRVQHFSFRDIKVNEKNFIAVIKCFPNIPSLYLSKIEFFCECNQWSTLCQDCSYQCFDVLKILCYLKKLRIFRCNFRIRCQSLEKFVKLCRIVFYSKDYDFQDLVENVKQFCLNQTRIPKKMFYLQIRTTSEEFTQWSQNIPKNLCIQNVF